MNIKCSIFGHDWYNEFFKTSEDTTVITGVCLRCAEQRPHIQVKRNWNTAGVYTYDVSKTVQFAPSASPPHSIPPPPMQVLLSPDMIQRLASLQTTVDSLNSKLEGAKLEVKEETTMSINIKPDTMSDAVDAVDKKSEKLDEP
jgi:hypothetical protein